MRVSTSIVELAQRVATAAARVVDVEAGGDLLSRKAPAAPPPPRSVRATLTRRPMASSGQARGRRSARAISASVEWMLDVHAA
jgi:hypothetical protein